MPIILIPFSVFFVCCLSQFYFVRRVRQLLVKRHPEVWTDISTRAWFLDNAVNKFIWRRKDKKLNDPQLTAVVKQAGFLYLFAFLVWVVYGVMLFSGMGFTRISFEKEPSWHPVLIPIERSDSDGDASSAL